MVWAIATMESEEQVRRWRDAFDITLPILLDTDGSVTAQYEQTMAFPTGAYPQEWLIGTDGVIEYYSNELEYDALVEIIERELAGG